MEFTWATANCTRKTQKTVKSSTRNKCKQKTIKIPWNEMTAFGLTTTTATTKTMKSPANKKNNKWKMKQKKRKHKTNSLKINTTDEKFLISSLRCARVAVCVFFRRFFRCSILIWFLVCVISFILFLKSLSVSRWNGFSTVVTATRVPSSLFLSISILLSFSVTVYSSKNQVCNWTGRFYLGSIFRHIWNCESIHSIMCLHLPTNQ